ncbi:MAG: hypothetical protein IJL52_05075 [Clostridia bacterium]|nr:hypothetical protein [Clostridia bacterium]
MKMEKHRPFGVLLCRPVGTAAAGGLVVFGCGALLAAPGAAKAGFVNGMTLCATTLLPSLLPFMILSSFFLRLTADGRQGDGGTLRLLRLPRCCAFVVLFSLIGGYPVGAALTGTLLAEKHLTSAQARRLLGFCVCPGPAFVMSAVGSDLLHSRKAGVLLYASAVLSALLLGLVTARFVHDEPQPTVALKPKAPRPVGMLLSAAVDDSTRAMLSVCGWVCFCAALLGLMDELTLPSGAAMAAAAAFEVTSGVVRCAGAVPLPVLAAVLAWGGVCTHCQVLGSLAAAKLPLWRFMLFRLLHAALCGAVCHGLLRVFPVTQSVMLFAGAAPVPARKTSFAVGAGILAMCLLLLLDRERLIFTRKRLEKSVKT